MVLFRRLFTNRSVKVTLAVVIMLLTFGAFGYYITHNPQAIYAVFSLEPTTIALLTVAYLLTMFSNAFVLWASLKIINKPMKFMENVALTGYSSIVNFFGPLQSGPGFRAAYLKKQHNVSIKSFLYLTVLFYIVFAGINLAIVGWAFITSAHSPWLTLFLTVLLVAVSIIAWLFHSKIKRVFKLLHLVQFSNYHTWYIILGAIVLSLSTTTAYFIELMHVDPNITFWQALVYGSAANLVLFVALTPGAIGFRESFLLLTEKLHGINPSTIIAASIIDRAFYVTFLLTLFVVLLLFGFGGHLQKIRSQKNGT